MQLIARQMLEKVKKDSSKPYAHMRFWHSFDELELILIMNNTRESIMDEKLARKLQQVGEHFRLPGPFFNSEEIHTVTRYQGHKVYDAWPS